MGSNISSHEFTPTMGDPGLCGVGYCGAPWFHPVHNPADQPKWGGNPRTFSGTVAYTEILNEAIIRAEKINALMGDEVTPKCPVGACQQTLPHLHPEDSEVNIDQVTPPHVFVMKTVEQMSNKYIENVDFCYNCDCAYPTVEFHPDSQAIRCPVSMDCEKATFNRPSHVARHLMGTHELTQDQAVNYLQAPWYVGETREEWQSRFPTPQQWWWRKYQAGPEAIQAINVKVDPEAIKKAMARAAEVMKGFRAVPSPEAHEANNPHKLDADQLQAVLTEWWMDKAEEESRLVVPKAVEYGATDLRDIGRDLAECMGREVTDEEAVELGIFFYLRGKMSRWIDAVKRGDRPSDDTIFDVGVYCRMAQRNRDAGGWPGLPTN